ncbi:sugar ABC transporter permease [Brachybacterium sp. NBEC-018]|uniref:carbohydrate ABC transporter permease n=1 Tax=Brachybacterium sp. NBEC-018 TaxID=2996004 RepID=UPI0021755ABD|nr:sugar ABC transporter permease [Brachybacterium sp. NBEC-018]UVY84127.1 sugar ABC transporter permease [Brachybacterium sp. NBEC-018]
MITRLLGRQPLGLLLAVPYIVFLAVVFAYPLAYAVWISFYDYVFAAPGMGLDHEFVGLANYRAAISDPRVRQSFVNIAVFLLINVPLTVLLSMVLASALNSITRWAAAFRVAFYVPYVTASVSLIGVWMLLFSEEGLVNTVLGPLAPSPSWLTNSALAMPSIALYVTWKQLGFYVLLYLAALQSVPRELYESASMDGAGAVTRFRHITVPSLRSTTLIVLILSIITGANLFTEPYLLTNGGGPDGASSSPVLMIYQKGIQQGNPDVASAIGVLLVIGVGLLSLLSARLTKES